MCANKWELDISILKEKTEKLSKFIEHIIKNSRYRTEWLHHPCLFDFNTKSAANTSI